MSKFEYAGLTDVGMKRTHNEDNLELVPEHNLFIVADGMGGHASGEVASQIAIETVSGFFRDSHADEDITWPFKEDKNRTYVGNMFVNSVRYANLRVFQKSVEDVQYKGMGTTFVGVAFHENKHYVAHVGDSRCYRVRNKQLSQITEDHSLLNDYKKMAKLTPEEERNFPHKNIIVRALGMKESVEVDLGTGEIEPGDLYVLCSDGLNGELEDPEILELALTHWDDLDAMSKAYVAEANAHGGKDNVTVICVKVLDV
ncbi:MAG: serine/threonine protein phosphatase PrpC [Myxococcota bacterium]|jgi:serine/threonine protein phosphatase PrpC